MNINEITAAIKQKSPNNLEPFDLNIVPPEIKPIIKELNQLLHRLQETLQREKRFTANAAHELKTPLAALKTHAQVALNANKENERNNALKNIIEGVDRSTHTIQQLLTLNRIISAAILVNAEPINITTETAQIIADLIPTARKKDIEIELAAPEKQQIITGNTTAINILIKNLLENAVLYTPTSGLIKINITSAKNNITLKITDNGPGIPEKLRKHVFERFYRIPGTGVAGSGLGLNIVQQIAQIHHAKIKLATPKSGKGLEVTVVFYAEKLI